VAAIPAGLSDVLSRPMDGVARVVITHEAHREFRWLVLLELALCFIGCLILLPCIALAIFGGGNLDLADLPDFRGRFHNWWQEIAVRVLDPRGRVLAEVRSRPEDREASQAIVAAVLGAARREGVVVVEAIQPFGVATAETRHVWYGGQPLLASPGVRAEQAAASVLAQHGLSVERGPDSVTVSYGLERPSRFFSWLLLLFIACPLGPALLIVPSGRRWLFELWADATGVEPPRVVYTIRPESLSVRTVRGGEERDAQVIDGGALLGVAFGPSLSWDRRRMSRAEATLEVVSTHRCAALQIPRPDLGPALRDLITAATIRMRAERPELGLLGAERRPTRCPYCSQLYVLEAGARCPSCGAPGLLQ